MDEAGVRLSAFGDEISDDLQLQLETLHALQIGYLELRGAWGKNVLHLTDDEVGVIAKRCAHYNIAISAIGSPVGKSAITEPLAQELANLERIVAIADALKTKLVRVFSFYPPALLQGQWSDDTLIEESIRRLATMSEIAARAGIQLLLENEQGLVADSVRRCQRVLEGVKSSNLAFAWDPGNFASVGENQAVTEGWSVLGPWTRHVHVKDYRLATGEILPAGEGEGEMDLLLRRLVTARYDGFLALEPHLLSGGRMGGFSGPEGMEKAAAALRALMAESGLVEKIIDLHGGEKL